MFLATVVPIALAYLHVATPLLRTSDLAVSYSVGGISHNDAELYRPLFMRGIYYVRLPALAHHRYQWFLANFDLQVVQWGYGPQPGVFGSFRIHDDQAIGINLLQAKIEDTWSAAFAPERVEFSNGTIIVTLAK